MTLIQYIWKDSLLTLTVLQKEYLDYTFPQGHVQILTRGTCDMTLFANKDFVDVNSYDEITID